MIIGKPKRLANLFQNYALPIFYITCVTAGRRQLLASDAIHASLRQYALNNALEGRVMGRYVIMPDHLHFFVRLAPENKVGDYVRWMKSTLTHCAKSQGHEGFVWQPGFFDHIMRSRESYAEKWEYVRMNPVRDGLAETPEEWPFQGEIGQIEM